MTATSRSSEPELPNQPQQISDIYSLEMMMVVLFKNASLGVICYAVVNNKCTSISEFSNL
jgi:membrane protein insertase Oxa1/YidC/SpoIIIJ